MWSIFSILPGFFTEVTDFSLTARWQSKQNLQLTRGFTNGKRRARERNGEKMAMPFPQIEQNNFA